MLMLNVYTIYRLCKSYELIIVSKFVQKKNFLFLPSENRKKQIRITKFCVQIR